MISAAFLFLLLPGTTMPAWTHHPLVLVQHSAEVNVIRGCLNGTATIGPIPARIGFLVPTFTLTPYFNWDTSFYAFYVSHRGAAGEIYSDLGMLRTKVVANWSTPVLESEHSPELSMVRFLESPQLAGCGVIAGRNLSFTDDVAVDAGALFANGSRAYDYLILAHEEYVTRAEYGQLKGFVAAGGTLVEMSGNTFWGEVNYSRTTGVETFVAGHGFQFNGRYAWATSYEPFDAESAGWFGSTFAPAVWSVGGAELQRSAFGEAMARAIHAGVAFTDYRYPHDEVNYLRNSTDTVVIARFFHFSYLDSGTVRFAFPTLPVDSYSHRYGKGEVFCLCVYGESIVSQDLGAQFFLVYALTLEGTRI